MSWFFHPDLSALPPENVLATLERDFLAARIPAHQSEIVLSWLRRHPHQWHEWPWGVLLSRVWEVFKGNGPMSLAKGAKKNTLNRIVDIFGERFGDPLLTPNDSDPIPFDAPPPRLEFSGRGFKFTLQAAFGMRSDCDRVISQMGGHNEDGGPIDYVVVGFLGEYERYRSNAIERSVDSHEPRETIAARISTDGVSHSDSWTMGRAIPLVSERVWLEQVWSHILAMTSPGGWWARNTP